MPRIKSGPTRRKKHKKLRKQAKGFRGHRGRSVRGAKEGILHALRHAYKGRRLKKREMRRLWIQRLNAAVREHDLSYSQFIGKMKEKNIELDRKVLSQIAVGDPETFSTIVEKVKS